MYVLPREPGPAMERPRGPSCPPAGATRRCGFELARRDARRPRGGAARPARSRRDRSDSARSRFRVATRRQRPDGGDGRSGCSSRVGLREDRRHDRARRRRRRGSRRPRRRARDGGRADARPSRGTRALATLPGRLERPARRDRARLLRLPRARGAPPRADQPAPRRRRGSRSASAARDGSATARRPGWSGAASSAATRTGIGGAVERAARALATRTRCGTQGPVWQIDGRTV